MDSDVNDDHPVIEVRTYRTHEGQRERLMTVMRELAFPVQRKLGIRLLGPFPSLDDPVTLVWLRLFPGQESREAMLQAFYEGPEWTQELEQQCMPLIESYASVLVEDHDRLWQRWPEQA